MQQEAGERLVQGVQEAEMEWNAYNVSRETLYLSLYMYVYVRTYRLNWNHNNGLVSEPTHTPNGPQSGLFTVASSLVAEYSIL